jgi:DNA-binding Xre family transcriptional regulator
MRLVTKARLAQQDKFTLAVAEAICAIMQQKNISRTQLAEMMEITKSAITQMLDGTSNLTLRRISDVCYCLGVKPKEVFR